MLMMTANNIDPDEYYMGIALSEAARAYEMKEVPIGCVITHNGIIIGRGANERNTRKNVLYHAEITAINMACEHLRDWRLEGCRLYVTIEPCPMCAGAIIQARIPTVIYGAPNRKAGCGGSILNILNEPRFNHRTEVIPGVCAKECGELMSKFFLGFREKEAKILRKY